ncbi:unnamed protein product [Bursaphelenchus xylophilus]|uniref:(pine wood nematode) hypothetical protein n=1 Tax=Bursaphelenchus xylophilus TaxID=6326 RepID=A0A7I8X9A8_BURXY|nr:unnamed protein product [Bursaphelenchus xylophilus]CAG9131985.1 unnamed protein product [Bursaphelenchus xylophilus]
MEVLDVMYIFLILLECISLVFELTCIFFSVFIVFCSLRYKAFHVNLRIIMVAFYSVTGLVGASEFLATSMAAIDINFRETSNMLAYLDKPLYRTLMTSIFTGCTIQVVLLNCAIMERTCASVWLVDYERKTHLFAMTVTMLLVALFTAWIFDKIYNMTLSDRMLTYGIVVAAVVASGFLILFVLVVHWNKARYRVSLVNSRRYTLSEKFQLSENIRMNGIIWRSIFYGGSGGFTAAVQVVLCYVLKDSEPLLAATFRVTCLITLNILFIPSFLTLIYRIPRWKKAFMALYRYTLMCPQVWNKVDVKKEVRIVNTITGKKLNFAIHEERDIYFDQLQRSWSAGI